MNCKNCGAPRDVYRASCEYCDTFHEVHEQQIARKNEYPSYASGIPINMPDDGYRACSGVYPDIFRKDYK